MGLTTRQKLCMLADDAKYDLSCSCSSGEAKEHRRRGLDGTWLYPVTLASGGSGIMLKTLMSNACSSDCKYCPLRHDGVSNRCSLTPDETAKVFMEYLRKQWLLGIFLSSGIVGTPDHTMELLTDAAAILREKYRYRGYIHLKIIPGASKAAIDRALALSSAVSLNIEVPGAKYFRQLSGYKKFDTDIVAPLKYISECGAKRHGRRKVKCSTQFIVGAATETDAEIMKYTGALYDRLKFKRVYFSAYQRQDEDIFTRDAVSIDTSTLSAQRLNREHRLYQADFLLRKYKFGTFDFLFGDDGNFSLDVDPKMAWVRAHPEFYPVKVNTADMEALLRIPGIGPTHAKRIVAYRKLGRLGDWSDIGLVGKNALKPLGFAVFD